MALGDYYFWQIWHQAQIALIAFSCLLCMIGSKKKPINDELKSFFSQIVSEKINSTRVVPDIHWKKLQEMYIVWEIDVQM